MTASQANHTSVSAPVSNYIIIVIVLPFLRHHEFLIHSSQYSKQAWSSANTVDKDLVNVHDISLCLARETHISTLFFIPVLFRAFMRLLSFIRCRIVFNSKGSCILLQTNLACHLRSSCSLRPLDHFFQRSGQVGKHVSRIILDLKPQFRGITLLAEETYLP